jgi:hypothetical protein
MELYNFFERIDDQERALKQQARELLVMRTCAIARKNIAPSTRKAIDITLEECRQNIAALKYIRRTTPIRLAIVTVSKGGVC